MLQAFLEHPPRLSTYDSFRCNSKVSRPSPFLRSAVSSSLSRHCLVSLFVPRCPLRCVNSALLPFRPSRSCAPSARTSLSRASLFLGRAFPLSLSPLSSSSLSVELSPIEFLLCQAPSSVEL